MSEFEKQQNKYTKLDKIGEGAFGVVYKAKDKESGELVALKRIRLDGEDVGVPCTAIREISLLKELKHPNIVRLLDVVYQLRKLTLVFEFLEQDLKKYIDIQNGNLEPGIIRYYMQDLLQGLAYCHSRNVLHRDLKPQNLLLMKGSLKVADFGLGRAVGIPVKGFTHEAVTLWYRAPDVLLGSFTYGTNIDMWSVGCIFAEMATGNPLFVGQNEPEQLLAIVKTLGTPSIDVWPSMHTYPQSNAILSSSDFLGNHEPSKILQSLKVKIGASGIELLRNLLVWEPMGRISANDALQASYFVES